MSAPPFRAALRSELNAELALTHVDARALTDQIKVGVEAVWQLVTRAYTERAWSVLGYTSWDDYCTREFGTSRLRLPREERQEVVSSLRDSGLSLRAIASATGDSVTTVRRELSGVPNGTPAVAPKPDVQETNTAPCIHCGATFPLSKLYEGGQGYECDPCVSGDEPGCDGSCAADECVCPDPDTEEQQLPPLPDNYMTTPQPAPVTGLDGKRYTPKPANPPAPPRRKPLTDAFAVAANELTKVAARITALSDDDRFDKNADQIRLRVSDLVRARDALQRVVDKLDN